MHVVPDNWIDVFEASVASELDLWLDLVRDVAYCFRGDGAFVLFLDELAYVTGTLPCSVQVDNLVGQAFSKDGFVFLDNFGPRGAVPASRGVDFYGTILALDCLRIFPLRRSLPPLPLFSARRPSISASRVLFRNSSSMK